MSNAAFTYAAFVVGGLAGVTRYTVRRDRRNKGTLEGGVGEGNGSG